MTLVKEPDAEDLSQTKRCKMVMEGWYEKLIEKFVNLRIVLFVRDYPKEVNVILGIPKNVGSKQMMILVPHRANLHYVNLDVPEIPHLGPLTQIKKDKAEELLIGKIDIENVYYRHAISTHLRPYFGIHPLFFDNNNVWPQLRVVPMGWSLSVTISKAIHLEVLDDESGLD